ncbi:MAG: cyclic nucleotide-binding domain-containing protein [Bacteroidia bacterium]|nr:cyclic nucleotide-binding domain-containing protein [Bacteroidia bacterium]
MTEAHFLSRVFPTPSFSAAEQAEIITAFRQVRFAKGDHLQEEGKTARYYHFMESGLARSYATDTEGRDISTGFYTSGDIVIDWTSFFLRSPAREHIQALSTCTCWQLDFETFQRLFHTIEAFREAGRTRLVQSYVELKNQSISMITDPARERYKRLLREKPEICRNVSLKQIASYLGITDTSLSRIRREIARGS